MMFRRRIQEGLWQRIRLLIWPRRSFPRSIRYMGARILRIPAPPHVVALGLAVGVFAAFTPLYGLHIILAILVAWLLSANIAAAAIGTAFANPLTIPLIFSATYELGRFVLHAGNETIPMHEFFTWPNDLDSGEIASVILQLLTGSAILGGIAAVLAYILVFKAMTRLHRRRKGMSTPRKQACTGRYHKTGNSK